MTPRYLLDTNIVSDLLRYPRGRVAAKIAEFGEASIATSIIVAAELRYGAKKKGSASLLAKLEGVLGLMTIVPLGAPADQAYAKIRLALEKAGAPIGANDLLIAAQAIALNMALVTRNIREFSRVQGLKLETWPSE